ncbi:MAG: SDR family oxidoreductase, partial [Pseudomonadota bacterium]|nr:SDR family oxidoreductase [Pseudomonadota bacterium]
MTKRALITDAASGIGAVIACEARRAGYEVVISDIDEDTGRALAEAHGLTFIRADLAAEDEIVALVRQVGCVDLLV